MSIRLVLLDLDGTLLDTAPDMGAALNALRAEHHLGPLPQERIRPQVSHGAPALLKLGFGLEPQDTRYQEMRNRYLAIYRDRLAQETTFFNGMDAVLDTLTQQGLRWGVVTNKPGALTEPLLDTFGLKARAACIVSGDSTTRRKPYPDPLLHACMECQVVPAEAVYVGDAQRDVEAARAAGMQAIVALYGYLGEDEMPLLWKADHMIQHPSDLLSWLASASARSAATEGAA